MLQNRDVFQVPTFTATFPDGESRDNFPISDHDPVVAQTAFGTMVSHNMWCPGSPIAPKIKPDGILTLNSRINQMNAMADYYFKMAVAGVQGFALQEVPNPYESNSGFEVLNNRLKTLCAA